MPEALLKADSITNSFTAIYIKPWRFTKIRLHHRLSKILSKIIIRTPKFSPDIADFEHVFVYWGIFRSNKSEEFWKITLFTRSGIFKTKFLCSERTVCSVYSKSLILYGETPVKILLFKGRLSQAWAKQMFLKISQNSQESTCRRFCI